MSIVFSTGFDHYSTRTQIFNTESIGNVTVAITTGVGARNNTYALQITNDGDYFAIKTLPTAITTVCMAFSFHCSAIPSGGRRMAIAGLFDNGSYQCRLAITTTGQLAVYRGSGYTNLLAIGSGSYALLPDVTYHISWKTVINNSTGSTIVRLNELEIINSTGLDTQETANSTVDQIIIAHDLEFGEPPITTWFDDLVVDDANLLPDLEVRTYFPNGVGVTQQWGYVGAPSIYEAIDDLVPNSDTDYATGATASEYSLLSYPDIGTAATIYAISPKPFAIKTDAGTATFASLYYNGATISQAATQAPSDSSYAYAPTIWLVNPATGITFTTSDFNSGQFGFKRIT